MSRRAAIPGQALLPVLCLALFLLSGCASVCPLAQEPAHPELAGQGWIAVCCSLSGEQAAEAHAASLRKVMDGLETTVAPYRPADSLASDDPVVHYVYVRHASIPPGELCRELSRRTCPQPKSCN